MTPAEIKKQYAILYKWIMQPDIYPCINGDKNYGVDEEGGALNLWSEADNFQIALENITSIAWDSSPTNYGVGDYCHVIMSDEQGYEIRMFTSKQVGRP